MNKKVISVIIIVVVVVIILLAGVGAYWYGQGIQGNAINTVTEIENNIDASFVSVCTDECGNGICQNEEGECDSYDCVCNETAELCPADCR